LIENSIFDPVRLAVDSRSPIADGGPIELGSLETEGPLIVYAGTLEPYQGIDILLEGFAMALKERPTLGLVIAGGSPDQVERYREMAQRLGIAHRCRLTGRVPQKVAKDLMSRAAALISPRTAGNNTPLKVYELLASGKPMIATDISSHTQVLSDDVAFMVEPSGAGIAAGILAATAPSDEPAKRSDHARRLYDERYSREIYTAKMRRLFERLSCAE
jgi:glycosyltransferase involved in cell wall biosynthesis